MVGVVARPGEKGGRGRGGFAGNTSTHTGTSSTQHAISDADRQNTPTLSDTQFSQLMSAVNAKSSSLELLNGNTGTDSWIIDTSTSNHMTGNINI